MLSTTKTLSLTLALTFSSQTAFANCSQPVTYLLVGTPASCSGFLFSPEKEQELRLEHEEYKYNLQLIELKDKQLDLYKNQVADLRDVADKERQKAELWRKNAEDATTKLVGAQERQGARDLIFTSLGVLLTVAAGWAIGQAANHK